jgi:hypothetical protein
MKLKHQLLTKPFVDKMKRGFQTPNGISNEDGLKLIKGYSKALQYIHCLKFYIGGKNQQILQMGEKIQRLQAEIDALKKRARPQVDHTDAIINLVKKQRKNETEAYR